MALQAKSFRRQDDELLLAVVLPDSSPGFIAASVTDILGIPEPVIGPATVLSVDGLRRFRSLVDAGAAKAPGTPSSRRRARTWKVVRHAHGADPFGCREWVYSAHTTEKAARQARDRVRGAMVRASGHEAAAKWTWAVVADPVGVLVNPPADRS